MKRIIKGLFVVLNTVVVLLLLASTLAGEVAPSRVLWPSLLSYAFFPLLVTNVFFVLLWLLASSKWFLLSTALILLRVSFLPLYMQFGSNTHPATADTLRVMTYNVHGCYGSNFISDMDRRLEQIDSNAHELLRIIDKEQPDVLNLQEFVYMANHTALADSLAARGYAYSVSASPQRRRYNTVTISRYQLLAPVYIDSVERMAVDVVKGSDTVRVMNLHLESYRLDEKDYQVLSATTHGDLTPDSVRSTLSKLKHVSLVHEQEWKEVEGFLRQSPHPCIVTGDFNDTPASYFYQNITDYLVDSYRECGNGFCTTYHGRFPAFRIDYVLHSPQLKTLSYKRVKSDLSDHDPLFVTLQINGNQE